jgi:uncharacterized membrane protein YozB (DUF420 family)
MAATTAAAAVAPERRLWTWVASVAALIIFAGFAQSFYLKPFFAGPALSPLLWAHGLLMSLWYVLLLVQLRLVASGRTSVHRRLGIFGALLAVLILVVGIATAIDAGRRGVRPVPGVTPLMFMAVPLADLLVFGVLVGVALVKRQRSATHKRLMLLASLAILPPAIARLPSDTIAQGGLPVIFGLMLLIMLVCIAIDTVRNRRLHPAFGWGGALVVLSVPARIALAGTDGWNRFAGWLIA